jgi:two-component system sensor histidine kinase YesM
MSYLKKVKFINSIQATLTLVTGLIIVSIITSVGFLLYNATSRVVEQTSTSATEQVIQQVNYDIEYYLKTISTTIDSLRYSDIVGNYFKNPTEITEARVINYLDALLISREDIINIVLLSPDGRIITNDKDAIIKKGVDFTKETYYEEAVLGKEMAVSSSHVQNIIMGQYQWVVSCSRSYIDSETKQIEGVILVDLNFNLIHDMVSRISLGEKGYIFIVDHLGQLVYHPKRELIYSGIGSESINILGDLDTTVIRKEVDGNVVDYIITSSNYSDWKVIGKVFVDDINTYKDTLRSFFIAMILTAFFVGTFLSIVLASRILSPVTTLLKGMDEFQSGQLDVEVEVEYENELGILTTTFNQMTKRIKALIIENKLSEKAKRKSELEALQAQINPHFLYNTLDSIVWMGEAGRSEEVVKMTSSLAKLFRISINKGEEYVTLKQEMEHVESYLTIQQMRYGDKLNYTIEVDESLLSTRLVKILIQPIVENAIYHGIKKLPGPGLIQIRVIKVEDNATHDPYMFIEIEDDGMGMDEATITKLLNGEISPEGKASGVGVYNVDQRIKLYYGDDYGLHIESELFEGTIVTFKLPILMTGGQHEKI